MATTQKDAIPGASSNASRAMEVSPKTSPNERISGQDEVEISKEVTLVCERCCRCQGPVKSMVPNEPTAPVPKESNASGQDLVSAEQHGLNPPPPPAEPYITYKTQVTNLGSYDDSQVVLTLTAYEPTVQFERQEEVAVKSVFDVVTTYQSAVQINYDDHIAKIPRTQEGCKRHIVIRSPKILDALRSVVDYYPEVDLTAAELHLVEPYRILVHHYDQLVEYHKNLEKTSGTDEQSATETTETVNPLTSTNLKKSTTIREGSQDASVASAVTEAESDSAHIHLALLLEFLSPTMEQARAEMQRNQRGFATFDMLWVCMKPGMDIAVLNVGPTSKGGVANRDAALLASVEGGPEISSRSAWKFYAWHLTYDGEYLKRSNRALEVLPFDGEMPIHRLKIIPLDLAEAPLGGPLRPYLVEQGRKWYSFLKPGCRQHMGEVLDFPFHQVEDQVMVDLPTFIEESDRLRQSAYPHYDPLRIGKRPKQPTYEDYSLEKKPKVPPVALTVKYSEYDDIRPASVPQLTDHQYLLCPQKLTAYFFKTRRWFPVDVSNLSGAQFDQKMIDTLVIDPQRINLLKALSTGFIREDSATPVAGDGHWQADFVKGKGNSQIFLLHGPPGVGKTFTAECMAEYTRRPLMTLSVSDIGTMAEEVDFKLEKNFATARKWGAILLIDEADVFLERRHLSDLHRNSLVAGFLRALEIYEGILFLTTNRVGSFDDAFISRIHVKLFYPALSDEDRKRIWDNFMKKLLQERGDKIKITDDAEEYLEGKKINRLELNGREIRNIFQTAVGLAEFENDRDKHGKIKLKKDHLKQVVEMSGEFKTYIDNVLARDEKARARSALLRDDDYDASKELKKKMKQPDSDDDDWP